MTEYNIYNIVHSLKYRTKKNIMFFFFFEVNSFIINYSWASLKLWDPIYSLVSNLKGKKQRNKQKHTDTVLLKQFSIVGWLYSLKSRNMWVSIFVCQHRNNSLTFKMPLFSPFVLSTFLEGLKKTYIKKKENIHGHYSLFLATQPLT